METAPTNAAFKVLLREGIATYMERSQVPRQIHLQTLRALSQRVEDHKQDLKKWSEAMGIHHDQITRYDQLFTEYQQELRDLQEFIKNIRIPEDGNDADEERVIRSVLAQLPPPKKGEPGKSADEARIIRSILTQLPPPEKGEPGKDATFEEEELFNKFVGLLKDNRLLDATHIKGLQGWIKDGIKYQYEELMHGAGISGKQEKSTTVPDGIQTTFPFAHLPRVIVWNGAIQTFTDDYTVAGMSIIFTASAGIPQTNDKVLNIYA